MRKNKLYIIILLCLISLSINSQSKSKATVKGFVYSESGETLPGATVIIKNSSIGTQADMNGVYQINNIPFGTYTITASFVGYNSFSQTIVLDTNNKSRLLDFNLSENTENLVEVIVKSKSEKTKEETKGFAVNVIEVKEIQFQSMQATDLLDQTSGVTIRQSGGMGSRVRYNINGLSGNSIRVFIDGIPVQNYGASFSLSSIPTSMIDKIEVYKGVVPIKLGSDALGGAINVVLNQTAANTLNASYSFGSFNSHVASLNGNYRNSNSGLTFKGSVFYNYSDNNYKVWGDEIYFTDPRGKSEYITAERFHDSYKSMGTKLDIGFTNVKWVDQFFVGIVASSMDRDIQHGAQMSHVNGQRRAEQATLMFNTSYNKASFLTKKLDVNLFASYSNLTRKVIDTVPYIYNWLGELTDYYGGDTQQPDGSYPDGNYDEHIEGAEAGKPTLNESLENTYAARANVVYHLNQNNKIGVNYSLQNFQRKPDDPLRPQAERDLIDTRYSTKNILGLSYEFEAFENKLKSSVFFKYYMQNVKLKDAQRVWGSSTPIAFEFSKQTDEPGYGIALSYTLTPSIQIMTSAENAIRLPENHEIFGNVSDNILSAYDLRPEKSFNVNLGFNIGPFYFDKHVLKLNSNFFYRDTEGKIKRVLNPQLDDVFQFENVEQILSTGVDVELNYSYDDKVTFSLGTSIFNSRFNKQFNEDGAEYLYYKDRERNAPYFTLNSNIRYHLTNFIQKKSRANVYYNLGYVHEFFRDWESLGHAGKDVIPSQLVSDIGFGYTFPNNRMTLNIDAKNIFNEQVFDNYALQKPGRAFYIKFNYRIK